jgi:site-specific DNA-methyltransferase (adenine-specific)
MAGTQPFYEEPGIALYQGDCLEVLPALGIKPVDVALLWADPPYGMRSVEQRGGTTKHGGKVARRQYLPVFGDTNPFDPAPLLVYPRAVLWGANYYASRLPDSPSWWTWDKKGKDWECTPADAELAWTNLGGVTRTARIPWLGGDRDKHQEGHHHPTQKPEALATWGFQRAGLKAGDLVVSPYLGSGPEAAAAKRMGLRFIGVELVPEYLNACVNRLRQGILFAGGL